MPAKLTAPAAKKNREASSPRIIGGMFGLEEVGSDRSLAGDAPDVLLRPQIRLASARGAIRLLVDFLAPANVWVPSYLCSSITEALSGSGTRIRFYSITLDLKVLTADWLSEVRPGDMVIFIDYFGFNTWEGLAELVRRRGATVVEDASQAMLSSGLGENSDYVVLSPRKFIGVPDGGLLIAANLEKLPKCSLQPAPGAWWADALLASQLRAEFDRCGGERNWFEIFRRSEAMFPAVPFQMSEISATILRTAPFGRIARRRRENFMTLASALPEFALFDDLPAGVVPLGFPIRVKNRDEVRKALFKYQIFAPVHWQTAGVVPPEHEQSHRLADDIMTIPCDQRYGASDMERVAEVFREQSPEPPGSVA